MGIMNTEQVNFNTGKRKVGFRWGPMVMDRGLLLHMYGRLSEGIVAFIKAE